MEQTSWFNAKHQILRRYIQKGQMQKDKSVGKVDVFSIPNEMVLSSLDLIFSVLTVAQAIDTDCAARLEPYGLSEGKMTLLLSLLTSEKGRSPHELAKDMAVSRATVTGLLDGLERDSWLQRSAVAGDSRRIHVKLTRQGKKKVEILLREHTQWMDGLFKDLSKIQMQDLLSGLYEMWAQTDTGKANEDKQYKQV